MGRKHHARAWKGRPQLIRRLAFFSLAGALSAAAQMAMPPATSALPPTPTTTGAAPLTATPDGTVARRTQKAQISFNGGLLDVRANNSSLNSILREVARITGMKLTGTMADQRVFGNYGPASPAIVLATLLDGTGSNMLLRGDAAAPEELVLTPRTGGPSPPSLPSPDEEEAGDNSFAPPILSGAEAAIAGRHSQLGAGQPRLTGAPGASKGGGTNNIGPPNGVGGLSGPRSIDQPINNIQGSSANTAPAPGSFPPDPSVAVDAIPTPSSAPPAPTGAVDAPNPPPPGSTTSSPPSPDTNSASTDTSATSIQNSSTSPTGTSAGGTTGSAAGAATTPEQVFQLLQQLRQQAAQQSGKDQ